MTPFDADGRPKLNAIRPHIDWLIDQGVAGISPIGTAGEFFAIEANDRKAVLEAVMKANNGRVPVVAGTHHYSTAITIDPVSYTHLAAAAVVEQWGSVDVLINNAGITKDLSLIHIFLPSRSAICRRRPDRSASRYAA